MNGSTSWKRALVLSLLVALFTCIGCDENKKATDACKASPTPEECKTCCKKNGAHGHKLKYIGETKECKCLGGG
jgi:hypothetical protein